MKKILLLFIPLLLGCSTSSSEEEESKIKEHDYSEIEKYTISWDNMFSISSDTHYLYCYSLTCHNCKNIKNNVIDKALKKPNTIYFCKENLNIQDLDVSLTIGMSDPNKVFIRGVPTLLKIENKKISNNILGAKSVLNEINSI